MPSLESWLNIKGNHPKMAEHFRFVHYYNLPRNKDDYYGGADDDDDHHDDSDSCSDSDNDSVGAIINSLAMKQRAYDWSR